MFFPVITSPDGYRIDLSVSFLPDMVFKLLGFLSKCLRHLKIVLRLIITILSRVGKITQISLSSYRDKRLSNLKLFNLLKQNACKPVILEDSSPA